MKQRINDIILKNTAVYRVSSYNLKKRHFNTKLHKFSFYIAP